MNNGRKPNENWEENMKHREKKHLTILGTCFCLHDFAMKGGVGSKLRFQWMYLMDKRWCIMIHYISTNISTNISTICILRFVKLKPTCQLVGLRPFKGIPLYQQLMDADSILIPQFEHVEMTNI
jgi:hypothetical protein